MTKSQKAFEEIVLKKFKDRWICDVLEKKPNGNYKLSTVLRAHEFFNLGWEARGKFDEEVCSNFEQEVWLKYKSENLLDSYHEGMSDGAGCCVVEIRKRGGE